MPRCTKSLGNMPLGSMPLGNNPLGHLPLGTKTLGSMPLGNKPLGNMPLDNKVVSCPTRSSSIFQHPENREIWHSVVLARKALGNTRRKPSHPKLFRFERNCLISFRWDVGCLGIADCHRTKQFAKRDNSSGSFFVNFI